METEIYLQSEDQEYITQEALRFSRAYDIANSDLWANLKDENGLDGNPKGAIVSEETRKKISKANKNKIVSLETRRKASLSNRGQRRSKEACENMSKADSKTWLVIDPYGNEQIITNLKKFCIENNLNTGHMHNVSTGKRGQYRGWICRKSE